MTDDMDDYDPEAESLLEYTARKVREKDVQRAAREIRNVALNPDAEPTHQSSTFFGLPQYLPAFHGAIKMMIEVLEKADSVERHVRQLRMIAEFMIDEANRLEAKNPASFQESHDWH